MVRVFLGPPGMDSWTLARDDFVGFHRWRARRGASLSLLVQRKEPKKAHPGLRAPAALRLGSASPAGILGRHILVPTQNAARPARRPAGLPTDAAAAEGAPGAKTKAKAKAQVEAGRTPTRVAASAVAFAFRVPVKAWQAGRAKPAGRRTGMCAVFGRGRMPLPKIPGPIADPERAARRARRQGCVSLPTFFAQAKKVGPRGERAIGEYRRQ